MHAYHYMTKSNTPILADIDAYIGRYQQSESHNRDHPPLKKNVLRIVVKVCPLLLRI